MPEQLGRWQQVIIDALDQHQTVGLQVLLEAHLGRRPTRAESIAARRTARRLEAAGMINLGLIRVPEFDGRRNVQLLVLTRSDTSLASLTDNEAHTAATGPVRTTQRSNQTLIDIVGTVEQAVSRADAVDVHSVDPETADQAARTLAVSLRRLTRLRQSLLTRRTGRQNY